MHRGSWGVTGLSKAGEVAGGSQAPGDGEMGGWAAIQPPPPGPPLRLITPHPQASSQAPGIQQEMNETRPFRMRSAGGQGPQASFRRLSSPASSQGNHTLGGPQTRAWASSRLAACHCNRPSNRHHSHLPEVSRSFHTGYRTWSLETPALSVGGGDSHRFGASSWAKWPPPKPISCLAGSGVRSSGKRAVLTRRTLASAAAGGSWLLGFYTAKIYRLRSQQCGDLRQR